MLRESETGFALGKGSADMLMRRDEFPGLEGVDDCEGDGSEIDVKSGCKMVVLDWEDCL